MKRTVVTFLTAILVTCGARPAVAQFNPLDCGAIANLNSSWQFGEYGLWLEYLVQTRREVSPCLASVSVEAWVVGIKNSGLTDSDLFTAHVRRQIPVFTEGIWQTNGKHYRTWLGVATYDNGSTVSHAMIRNREASDPAYECALNGGTWNGWECNYPNCPIIVDTGRDGYRLTSTSSGVRFDLDADGTPEQVAWTRAESDDAFLAMDRNGNGRIDDGTELFGNHTPAFNDRRDVSTANGFEALKFLESVTYGQSRLDAAIDIRDAPFSRLLLWRDVNHNGISEPDELTSAADAGLVAISTDYREKKRVDRHGNEFRQKGRLTWADGAVEPVFDIWLQWRQ